MDRRRFLASGIAATPLAVALSSLGACGKDDRWPEGMQPIKWDRDTCVVCNMVISDRRFAGQLRGGPKKTVFKFDDPGCVALWLNDKARLFIPNDVGGDIGEWLPHHLTNRIRIVIARPDVLLAMKLRAGRGRRDSDDLPALVEACGYTTRAQAEACFAEHYPDDAMKPKSQAWIEANLE